MDLELSFIQHQHWTRPAEAEDAFDLADRLRFEDAEELRDQTGREPLPVLLDAIEQSAEAWATFIGGELACLWGVHALRGSALAGSQGSAWLLTADTVEFYPKTFMRLCRAELPRLLERWDFLSNCIDVRHDKAIRWAERLGFHLDPPHPYGPRGLPSRRFLINAEDVVCAHQWL